MLNLLGLLKAKRDVEIVPDMHGARIVGADLSGRDLSGVDFSGATLARVDASGANLRGANFAGVTLRHCKLFDAQTDGTIWTGAKLIHVHGLFHTLVNWHGIDMEISAVLDGGGRLLFRDHVRGLTVDEDELLAHLAEERRLTLDEARDTVSTSVQALKDALRAFAQRWQISINEDAE